MRWLLLNRCEDADSEANSSPHPLIVHPRTLLVPLLPLLVPLLIVLFFGVLCSVVRGLLKLCNL
jgi:hypothetical protein